MVRVVRSQCLASGMDFPCDQRGCRKWVQMDRNVAVDELLQRLSERHSDNTHGGFAGKLNPKKKCVVRVQV